MHRVDRRPQRTERRNSLVQMQKVSTVIPSGLRFAFAAVLVAGVVSGAAGQTGSTVTVNAGDNLQAALDAAQPGQTLLLPAGATFTGNFVLPKKAETSTSYITIRTATADARLPADDERIALADEALLPTLHSANSLPAVRTAPGAHHWRLFGVRVTGGGTGDVIDLGDGVQTDRALVPSDLVIDRVVVRGDAAKGQKRGIALNSANTWVRNSYITGIKLAGQETQAIAGWNGPGPFVVENNYIEAGSIGILFGGAEPTIDHLTPTDIVVRHNHVTRPLDLRTGSWVIKNLLELKHASNVQISGNIFENNWSGAQSGFAIVFTVRANGTHAPWTVVEHVRFENNVVRHSGSAVNILGYDDTAPSQQAHDILIRNNVFSDIDHRTWGGSGIFLQIGDEPADLHVEHNTVIQSGNIISVYGGTAAAPRPVTGFRFASNIVMHNTYGIFGNQVGMGNPAIAAYFPQSVIVGNVMAGGPSQSYPSGNVFPSVTDLMGQFRSPSTGDYSLIDTSPLRTLAAGEAGTEFGELQRATVVLPRSPKNVHSTSPIP